MKNSNFKSIIMLSLVLLVSNSQAGWVDYAQSLWSRTCKSVTPNQKSAGAAVFAFTALLVSVYCACRLISGLNNLEGLPAAGVVGSSKEAVIDHGVRANAQDNNNCSYGSESLRGLREHMEDVHQVLQAQDHQFFAVYDGHNGVHVAKYLEKYLYQNIITDPLFNTNIKQAIMDGCKKTNDDLKASQEEANNYTARDPRHDNSMRARSKDAGSTATFAFIKNGVIYTGNVGDFRTIITTQDCKAKQLSKDHKPNDPVEYDRITRCKGRIILGQGTRIWRVFGPTDISGNVVGLATSRAFGDFILSQSGVTAVPEITEHVIGANDKFLILACDGIWDVCSNQQVAQVVQAEFNRSRNMQRVANKLVTYALNDRKSTDNGTAIVVELNKARTAI